MNQIFKTLLNILQQSFFIYLCSLLFALYSLFFILKKK